MSPNGDVYEGQWRNGKKHGRGTYTQNTGNVCTAGWANCEEDGQGEQRSPERVLIHKGLWLHNQWVVLGIRTSALMDPDADAALIQFHLLRVFIPPGARVPAFEVNRMGVCFCAAC